MIAILDVDYRDGDTAVAACVTVRDFADAAPVAEYTATVTGILAYEPGQFYKRELPCLLAVLKALPEPPTVCVVDGYVWLGDETKPGLGAHLFAALGKTVPVIGVAKTRFASVAPVAEVPHGETETTRPLYVSSVGLPLAGAADAVRRMHGAYRLPTLIKRVDLLCRAGEHPRRNPSAT